MVFPNKQNPWELFLGQEHHVCCKHLDHVPIPHPSRHHKSIITLILTNPRCYPRNLFNIGLQEVTTVNRNCHKRWNTGVLSVLNFRKFMMWESHLPMPRTMGWVAIKGLAVLGPAKSFTETWGKSLRRWLHPLRQNESVMYNLPRLLE